MDGIMTMMAQALDEQMYQETLVHLGVSSLSDQPQSAGRSPDASESRDTPAEDAVTRL